MRSYLLKYLEEEFALFLRSHKHTKLSKDLKICTKFTGEHSCRSVISIKLQSNFIEIALRHGCSPVNLLHIFRTPITKNTSGRLLLYIIYVDIYYICSSPFYKEYSEKDENLFMAERKLSGGNARDVRTQY